ncbi:hypothetical protein ABWH89_20875 [Hoeflea alexandrii]|uniref:hypothetical protein n=1 Tax=Hoeflea alexandrii TaxID=288436 RepID=UPI0035CF0275
MSDDPNKGMPPRAQVRFDCLGQATGKMRNELSVHMKLPFEEGPFELATDEGSFHGGDASAPPPLALFTGGTYRLHHDPDQGLRQTSGRHLE